MMNEPVASIAPAAESLWTVDDVMGYLKASRSWVYSKVASGETITAAELVERLNASRDAVYQQLSRMARAGDVERLAMGVYVMREVSR